MNEKQAIKQFLWHPFTNVEFECRCGGKLRNISLGADFTKGDACFECRNCENKMIVSFAFVDKFPEFQDKIELIIVKGVQKSTIS